jgi:hypothetical protein
MRSNSIFNVRSLFVEEVGDPVSGGIQSIRHLSHNSGALRKVLEIIVRQ